MKYERQQTSIKLPLWNSTANYISQKEEKNLLLKIYYFFVVFQDLSRTVSPPSAIYSNFLQMWAAPPFPLYVTLWDNTVHQGISTSDSVRPPLRRNWAIVLSEKYIIVQVNINGFFSSYYYSLSYSTSDDNHALSFGPIVWIISGLWGMETGSIMLPWSDCGLQLESCFFSLYLFTFWQLGTIESLQN